MIILLIISSVVLVGLDQLVKFWAVRSLKPVGSMDFLKIGELDILDLTYLENDGAIFGSMSGQKWFLIGFTSLIVLIGIFVMFYTIKRSKFMSFSVMLFVAGGIGNLIDRIRFGYVVDMFEIKLFNFAIFNVADICVTFAFVFMLVYVLFIEPKAEKAKKSSVEALEENE